MSADRLYKDGDIVWVRLGNNWWPAEVIDGYRQPVGLLRQVKYEPYCVVKFFEEDRYEIVKRSRQIYPFKCDKKEEFIKKGLALLSVNHSVMKKFPADVEIAERLTRRVVESDLHVINDRPYSILKAIIGQKLTSASSNDYNNDQDLRASSSKKRCSGDSFTKILNITPTRTIEAASSAALAAYRCNFCDFTSRRQNVMILHNKTHSSGGNCASANRVAVLHKSNHNSTHASSDDKDKAENAVDDKRDRAKVSKVETHTKDHNNQPTMKDKRNKTPVVSSKRSSTIRKVEKISTLASEKRMHDTANRSVISPPSHSTEGGENSFVGSKLQRSSGEEMLIASADVVDKVKLPAVSDVNNMNSSSQELSDISRSKKARTAEEAKINPQDFVKNLEADWSDGEELITADPVASASPGNAEKALGELSDLEEPVGAAVELAAVDSEVIVDAELVLDADADAVAGEGECDLVPPTAAVTKASTNILLPKSSGRIRNIPKKDRRDIILKEFHQNENNINSQSSASLTLSGVATAGFGSNSNSPECAAPNNEKGEPISDCAVLTINEGALELKGGDAVVLLEAKSQFPTKPQGNQDTSTVTTTESTEPHHLKATPTPISSSPAVPTTGKERSCFDFEDEEETDTDLITSIANFKKKQLSPVKNANATCKSDEYAAAEGKVVSNTEEPVQMEWKDKQLADEIDSLLLQTKATVIDIATVASETREDVPVKALPIKERGKRIFKSRNRSRPENQSKVLTLTLSAATEGPPATANAEKDKDAVFNNIEESSVKSECLEDTRKIIEHIETQDEKAIIEEAQQKSEQSGEENPHQELVGGMRGRDLITSETPKEINTEENSRLFHEEGTYGAQIEQRESAKSFVYTSDDQSEEGHLFTSDLAEEQVCALDSNNPAEGKRNDVTSDEEVIPMIRHAPVEVYKEECATVLEPLPDNGTRSMSEEKQSQNFNSPKGVECDLEGSLPILPADGDKTIRRDEKDDSENYRGPHRTATASNDIETEATVSRFTSPTDENSSIGISEAGAEFGSPASMLDDERLRPIVADEANLVADVERITENASEVRSENPREDVALPEGTRTLPNETRSTENPEAIVQQDTFILNDKPSRAEESVDPENEGKEKCRLEASNMRILDEGEGVSQVKEEYNEMEEPFAQRKSSADEMEREEAQLTQDLLTTNINKDEVVEDDAANEAESTAEQIENQIEKSEIEEWQEIQENITEYTDSEAVSNKKEMAPDVVSGNHEHATESRTEKLHEDIDTKGHDKPCVEECSKENDFLNNKNSTSHAMQEIKDNMDTDDEYGTPLLVQVDPSINMAINEDPIMNDEVLTETNKLCEKDANMNADIQHLHPDTKYEYTKSATDNEAHEKCVGVDASSPPLSEAGKNKDPSSRKRRSHIKITPRKRLADTAHVNQAERESTFIAASKSIKKTEAEAFSTPIAETTEAATLSREHVDAYVVVEGDNCSLQETAACSKASTSALTEMRSFRPRRKTNPFDAAILDSKQKAAAETTEKPSINLGEFLAGSTNTCDPPLLEKVRINVDVTNPLSSQIANILAASGQQQQQQQQQRRRSGGQTLADKKGTTSNLPTTTTTISKNIASSMKRKKSIEDDIPSFIIERPSCLSASTNAEKEVFAQAQNKCPQVKITRKEKRLDLEAEQDIVTSPPATSEYEDDQVMSGADGSVQTPAQMFTLNPPPAKQQKLNIDSAGIKATTTLFDIGSMPILLANANDKLPENVHIVITQTADGDTASETALSTTDKLLVDDIPSSSLSLQSQATVNVVAMKPIDDKQKIIPQPILQSVPLNDHAEQQQLKSRKTFSSSSRSKRGSIGQQQQRPQSLERENTKNMNTALQTQKLIAHQKLAQEQQRFFHEQRQDHFPEEKCQSSTQSHKQIGTDSRGKKYVIIKTPPIDLVIQQQQQQQQQQPQLTLQELQQNTITTKRSSVNQSTDQRRFESSIASGLSLDQSVTSTIEASIIEEIGASEPPQQFKQRSPAAAATGGRKQAGNTITLPTNASKQQQQQQQQQQQLSDAAQTAAGVVPYKSSKSSSPAQQKHSKSSGIGSSNKHQNRANSVGSRRPKAHQPNLPQEKLACHRKQMTTVDSKMVLSTSADGDRHLKSTEATTTPQKVNKKSGHCSTSGDAAFAQQRIHTHASQPPPLHHLHSTKKTKKIKEKQRGDKQHITGSSRQKSSSEALRTDELQPNSMNQTQQPQSSSVQSSGINEEQLMQIESEEQIDGTSKILAVPTQPISGYSETFLLCTLVNNNYKPIDNVPLYLDHDLNQLVPVPLEALDGQPNLIVTHPPPEEIVNQLQTTAPIEQDDSCSAVPANGTLADALKAVEADNSHQMIYIQPSLEDNEAALSGEVVHSSAIEQMDDPSAVNSDAEDAQMAVYIPPDCSAELPSENAVILNIEGQQIILDAATFAHLLANPDANTQLITDDGTEFVLTREVLAALEAQQDSQEETTMREQQQQLEQHLQQAHQIREAGPTDILAVALAGTDLYSNEVLEIETSQGLQLVGADGIVFQSGSLPQPHLTPPITAHTSETNALLNQTPIMSTLEKPSTSGKRKPTESSAAELFAAAVSASDLPTCRPNLEDSLAVIGVTAQSSSSVPASLELPITVTNPAIAPKSTMAGPTAPVGLSSTSTIAVTEAVQFHCLPHRTGLAPGEARIYNDPGS